MHFLNCRHRKSLIEKVIFEEEQSFLADTLESGDKRLKDCIALLKGKREELDGKIAFELYDTYGFPLDLTELILKENGLTVNKSEFDNKMAEQRKRSKSAATVDSADWEIVRPETDQTEFIGYNQLFADVFINKFRKVSQKDKQYFHLVFDKTPFYAESGGQIGDIGYIDNGKEKIKILTTFKEHGLTIHVAEKLPQNLTGVFRAAVIDEIRSGNSL